MRRERTPTWARPDRPGMPADPRPRHRYRRAYDGSSATPGRRRERQGRARPSLMYEIRERPLRSGLIGLAIAGTAIPVAMERMQTSTDRVDPSHERQISFGPEIAVDDSAVSQAWNDSMREGAIQEAMERHADFNLGRAMAEEIYDAAVEHDIEPDVAFGLVRAESGFRNSATSHVGAVGLTQLMPRTAAWMVPGTSTRELRNPSTNLDIGFLYLRYLLDKYDQDMDLALLAYNRGPGTVDRVLRRGGNPHNGYVEMVFAR